MQIFHTIFRPEPEGGYTVIVPSLPGCITWAETIEEGNVLIKDAIQGYLASVKKHEEKLYDDSKSFISSVSLEYA